MTSEGLGEILKVTCSHVRRKISTGDYGGPSADPGARTPIGASGNLFPFNKRECVTVRLRQIFEGSVKGIQLGDDRCSLKGRFH